MVRTGKLSSLQLEAVAYACQAHETRLPDGSRAGFFIGDGAGVSIVLFSSSVIILLLVVCFFWLVGRRLGHTGLAHQDEPRCCTCC